MILNNRFETFQEHCVRAYYSRPFPHRLAFNPRWGHADSLHRFYLPACLPRLPGRKKIDVTKCKQHS